MGSLPGGLGAAAILAGRKGTGLLLADLSSVADAVPMLGSQLQNNNSWSGERTVPTSVHKACETAKRIMFSSFPERARGWKYPNCLELCH